MGLITKPFCIGLTSRSTRPPPRPLPPVYVYSRLTAVCVASTSELSAVEARLQASAVWRAPGSTPSHTQRTRGPPAPPAVAPSCMLDTVYTTSAHNSIFKYLYRTHDRYPIRLPSQSFHSKSTRFKYANNIQQNDANVI